MKSFSLPPLTSCCARPAAGRDTTAQTMLHQFAESLGNAIDAKDHCTRNHSEEVAVVGQILALSMGYSPAQADTVHVAGHLHDIGKIALPDSVLRKPGPLTPAEWALVRRHPEDGAAIIRPCAPLNAPGGVADIAHQHHERQDGSGYPRGLSGSDICPGARILAVADSLSAMLQDRPYRCGMSFEDAMKTLRSERTIYDPRVLQALDDCALIIKDNLAILRCTPEAETHGSAPSAAPPIGAVLAAS